MKYISSTWDFLNGKKTVIGTVLFFAGVQAQNFGLVDTGLLKELDTYAEQIGTILLLLGLGHKTLKAVRN